MASKSLDSKIQKNKTKRPSTASQPATSRPSKRSRSKPHTSTTTTISTSISNGKSRKRSSRAEEQQLTSSGGSQSVELSEEEYEVEAIRAHRRSEEHQEYEYLLKWKGYGEEENSWVTASYMNCWDLLQKYLSKNIFNKPFPVVPSFPSSSSSSFSSSSSSSSSSSLHHLRSRKSQKEKNKRKVKSHSSKRNGAQTHKLHREKLNGQLSHTTTSTVALVSMKALSYTSTSSSSRTLSHTTSSSSRTFSNTTSSSSSSSSSRTLSHTTSSSSSSLCSTVTTSTLNTKPPLTMSLHSSQTLQSISTAPLETRTQSSNAHHSTTTTTNTPSVTTTPSKTRTQNLCAQPFISTTPSEHHTRSSHMHISPSSTPSVSNALNFHVKPSICNGPHTTTPSETHQQTSHTQTSISSPPLKHCKQSFLKSVVETNSIPNKDLRSPSASPIILSCDDLSSSQSDCSITVDENFHLCLDSDEDNSSSDSTLSTESSYNYSPASMLDRAPHKESLLTQNLSFLSSHQRPLNGYQPPLQHYVVTEALNGVIVFSNGRASSDEFSTMMSREDSVSVASVDGWSPNVPTSTTGNEDNSDSSESWSKKRLRRRALSPTSQPEVIETHSNSKVSSTSTCKSNSLQLVVENGGGRREGLTLMNEVEKVNRLPIIEKPLRGSPSPEYQQELLEWQFSLNKQCRPAEAFVLVENRIDEATVPWGFKYITSNIYGEGVPNPQASDTTTPLCGCTCYITGRRCGPRTEHCCPKLAGAEFPYTIAGKVRLSPGNPIFECNSYCSCPPDCTNRVVQRGRKTNMCIFRTTNGRGWGVKTLEPIKPNTFVTEYVGEVVTTEEAERRGQLYDKEGRTYLFDLDFNCDDNAFTIDAAQYGNISHFFNHSCNPNLRVYSVWIDTLDDRLPRIAFFSTRNISAGQELTFDYQMNQDELGQIPCLCHESNCCGYLY